MKLFKIITQRDETVIGLKAEDLRNFGPSGDLENLAQRIGTVGQMVVWQDRGQEGQRWPASAGARPAHCGFPTGMPRIEPYTTPTRCR